VAANKSSPELLNVVLNAELPAQVLSRRYEQYLFFDSDISSSDSIISAVQSVVIACFGMDVEVDIFSSSNRSFLANLGQNPEWAVEISRLGKILRDASDFGGMILVDKRKRWVVYQSRPVDMGIVAIDGQGKLDEVEALKDDFFDCTDISGWLAQRTARDIDLVQGFGSEFLEALLKNYQWSFAWVLIVESRFIAKPLHEQPLFFSLPFLSDWAVDKWSSCLVKKSGTTCLLMNSEIWCKGEKWTVLAFEKALSIERMEPVHVYISMSQGRWSRDGLMRTGCPEKVWCCPTIDHHYNFSCYETKIPMSTTMKTLAPMALCIALLATSGGVHAAASTEFTIGEPNCLVINRFPKPNERIKWSGGCKNGYAEGHGTLEWFEGDTATFRFEGSMVAGMSDGIGSYTFLENGASYSGGFKAGKRHGQGTLTLPSGQVQQGRFENDELVGEVEVTGPGMFRYVGGWLNGRPHGIGWERHQDGAIYEGEFRAGLAEGQGTVTLINGQTISGHFEKGDVVGVARLVGPGRYRYQGGLLHGRPHGEGDVVYTDGVTYKGTFRNGLRDGVGFASYPDGSKFNGTWIADKSEGRGTLTHANGSVYEGEVSDGLPYGMGKSRSPLGLLMEGTWRAGRLDGEGRIIQPDGATYTGTLVAGTLDGRGVMRLPDGSEYAGEFKSGKRHGTGVLIDAEGTRREGIRVADQLEGQGTEVSRDGLRYVGGWHLNRPHGAGTMELDGHRIRGQWDNGILNGPASIEYDGGAQARGNFLRGQFNGHWTLTSPSGEKSVIEYEFGNPKIPNTRLPAVRLLDRAI
jgi:hypothetical protein